MGNNNNNDNNNVSTVRLSRCGTIIKVYPRRRRETKSNLL